MGCGTAMQCIWLAQALILVNGPAQQAYWQGQLGKCIELR